MQIINDHNLYLVISSEYLPGLKPPLDVAKLAIQGGIDILQMREKNIPRDEILLLGKGYLELCRENKVLFIVNDDPYLASQIDADGLHIGQEDFSAYTVKKLRSIMGGKIIGISTHSLEQFKKANDQDFDYISFGPIFPTKTKDYFIGFEEVENVLKIASKPVVFIGGINIDNINILLGKGAKNIALIRDIIQAEEITQRTKLFKQRIMNFCGKKMIIKINGENEGVEVKANLSELIMNKNLNPAGIVIEHNGSIIPKEKWADVFLNDNDNIEIVSFVSGG